MKFQVRLVPEVVEDNVTIARQLNNRGFENAAEKFLSRFIGMPVQEAVNRLNLMEVQMDLVSALEEYRKLEQQAETLRDKIKYSNYEDKTSYTQRSEGLPAQKPAPCCQE